MWYFAWKPPKHEHVRQPKAQHFLISPHPLDGHLEENIYAEPVWNKYLTLSRCYSKALSSNWGRGSEGTLSAPAPDPRSSQVLPGGYSMAAGALERPPFLYWVLGQVCQNLWVLSVRSAGHRQGTFRSSSNPAPRQKCFRCSESLLQSPALPQPWEMSACIRQVIPCGRSILAPPLPSQL